MTVAPRGIHVDPRRVLLEVRHARLRLAMTDVELETAAILLAKGWINPEAALDVLDDAMETLMAGGPWTS